MKKQKKRKYDSIISDLDKVISKLNSVNTPIEESIKLFEEGIKLSDEAEKEILEVEKNIEKIKKIKINSAEKNNIEKSLDEVDAIIENLEDEEISLEKAEDYYKKANEKILGIEAYLKKAKSIIKKYEQ